MNKPDVKKLMNMKRVVNVAKVEDKEYQLTIYGSIGGWSWENTSEYVGRQLKSVDADVIHVHINSGGGDVFEGIAIGNILKQHPAKVVVHVDGFAASAASIIAMAGDEIIMPSNTMLMIHRASTYAFGNAVVLGKIAADLTKIDESLTASYKSRFKGTDDELDQLIDDETWFTAEEAVALGLADTITDEIEIVIDEEDEQDDVDEEEPIENLKDRLVAQHRVAAVATVKEPIVEDKKIERFNALLKL